MADSSQDLVTQLKASIREIAHEMNNNLGILRTAVYLVESTKDETKLPRYLAMINTGIDRLEADIKRLRALRDSDGNPPTEPPQPPRQQ